MSYGVSLGLLCPLIQRERERERLAPRLAGSSRVTGGQQYSIGEIGLLGPLALPSLQRLVGTLYSIFKQYLQRGVFMMTGLFLSNSSYTISGSAYSSCSIS